MMAASEKILKSTYQWSFDTKPEVAGTVTYVRFNSKIQIFVQKEYIFK